MAARPPPSAGSRSRRQRAITEDAGRRASATSTLSLPHGPSGRTTPAGSDHALAASIAALDVVLVRVYVPTAPARSRSGVDARTSRAADLHVTGANNGRLLA